MFLRNAWYVAATDREIGRTPLRRIIMNEPIVMYRTEAGLPVALEDRCVHRHLPLSMGKLVAGDILECLYHGLCYDTSGACVKVPGQPAVPPGARVKAYPMVERYHWVWIWMGDPALADPATITDFHWFDDPNWGAAQRYLHVKGNWQLVVDNLLDLTHLAFVHTTTIGTRALVDAKVKVDRSPDDVLVTRWTIDAPAPPTFIKAGGFTSNVDRWQIIHFTPPSFVRLDVGATPTGTGAPEGRRVGGISMRNLNAMTPETETTTHYFYGQAHDFDIHNPNTTEMIMNQITTAFLEDQAVFEAQQANMLQVPDAPQVDINADTGVLQARRILDRLHAEEQAALGSRRTAAE